METIVPYKEEFKKYIPEQYKNSEKLLALVNSCMAQFDDLETAFFEILQALNLADAIGPALDYLGAIVGVKRNPGESDTQYRERIVSGLNLLNLPGPEALRMVIKFLTGVDSVGLFPNWPAEMYYVLDGGTDANLSNLEKNSMTSGASLVRGTFLCMEPGEGGYIVNDDNGMPFVVDYVDIMEIPDNVFRFTFSKPDYDPTVAGIGPHGTWTKVETSNQNEWDWAGTPEDSEFNYAFPFDYTYGTNWVSIRCKRITNEISCRNMFYRCSAITDVELHGMTGVQDMYQMFLGNVSLKTAVIDGAQNCKNSSYIFYDCGKLESVRMDTVGTLDDDNVAYYQYNLYYTFAYCVKLKNVNLGDLSSVKQLNHTFYDCIELEEITIDIPNAETLLNTFENCEKLKSVTLKNSNNVTHFSRAFVECASMVTSPNMDTSGAVSLDRTFTNCTALKNVREYDTSNVEILQYTFQGCTALEYLPDLTIGNQANMLSTFNGCSALKEIPRWDYSSVTNFAETFNGCRALKEIPEWLDVSGAQDSVSYMFSQCVNIERGAAELYNKLAEISPTEYQSCFKDCGVNTISGIGDLTKIPTTWGGLGALPANSLLFNFGDPNYDPNVTTTSKHGTWTSYSTGYADSTFNLWLWTYGGGEYGWAREFMPNLNHSYLSDFENNPVDVVAHGDLTDIKCYADLFLKASALRYCCDFVIPDASVNYYGYDGSLQGMFSRCENLKVLPHVDVSNLYGMGLFADECPKLEEINPPTIRSFTTESPSFRSAFKNCPNVERGAAETYAVLKNITYDNTDCFTNCGVNKLTGVSDLFKIPTSWGGLANNLTANSVIVSFANSNFDPSNEMPIASGSWSRVSVITNFNAWEFTSAGTDLSEVFKDKFIDAENLVYILGAETSNVVNVDRMLDGCTAVEGGALNVYEQMSTQTTPPASHVDTFRDCGTLTEHGRIELAQIPTTWGGTLAT